MRTAFTLKGIDFNGIKIGEISVDCSADLEELKGVYELSRKAIKELPETLEDLKKAYDKFVEIDSNFVENLRPIITNITNTINGNEDDIEMEVKIDAIVEHMNTLAKSHNISVIELFNSSKEEFIESYGEDIMNKILERLVEVK